MGYNFVRLACEIISMMSVIKPYIVFKNEEIPIPSNFALTLQHMLNNGWSQYNDLYFFTQNPLEMRENYLKKTEEFANDTHGYEKFIKTCLNNIIEKDLHPLGLDIRKILEFYEPFACSYAFKSLIEMSHEKDTITLINTLKILTDFVRWGNIRAFYLIEVEEIFKSYFDVIS